MAVQSNNVSSEQVPGSGKNNKSMKILIAVFAVIVIALIGVVIFLLTRPKETVVAPVAAVPEEKPESGRGVLVTPDNVDELVASIREPIQDGSFMTSMNVDWTFEDGTSPSSDAYIENAPENTRMVYFDVILSDTSETVYSSPFIPVGSRLSEITLDKDLDAGTYEAVVEYHLVDDDKQEISTVSVSVNLHILN